MFRHGINYNTCSKNSWSNEIERSVGRRRNSCNQNLYILQHTLQVPQYHDLDGFYGIIEFIVTSRVITQAKVKRLISYTAWLQDDGL